MIELAEHPIVNVVRQYAEDAADASRRGVADASRLQLTKALAGIDQAVGELSDAVATSTPQAVNYEYIRRQLGRLLGTQIALWQSLVYVEGAAPLAGEVRDMLAHTMHGVGEVIELVAFKLDRPMSDELQRRIAAVPAVAEPTDNWRDILDAL